LNLYLLPELGISSFTDEDGFFFLSNIPISISGYTVYITKPGFLLRKIEITSFNMTLEISDQENPIPMWPGDMILLQTVYKTVP